MIQVIDRIRWALLVLSFEVGLLSLWNGRGADGFVIDIASKLGSPHLSLIPIAAGACLPYIERLTKLRLDITSLTRHIHAPPADAMKIHNDLGSSQSLGIHWGTFTTELGAGRTRAEFERVKVDGFDVCDVGVWRDVTYAK